jgi:hypothetical protein
VTDEAMSSAAEDAIDELGRIDAAPDGVDPFDQDADPLLTRPQGVAATDGPSVTPTSTARVIEDLYVDFPDIGSGTKFLRVIRKFPRIHAGVSIAGYMPPDIHEQIGSEEFVSRYGGGTYDILVMGAVRGALDDSGEPKLRTLRSLRLDFSGPPKMGMDAAPPALGANVVDPRGYTQVEITRMQIDERDRIRREQEQRRAAAETARSGLGMGEVLAQVEQSANRAAEDTRQSLTYIIDQQQLTIGRLEKKLQDAEDATRVARDHELELQREYAAGNAREESRTITELRAKHEAEIGTMRTSHDQQLTFLRSEHERSRAASDAAHTSALEALNERRDREREARDEAHRVERDRMREDYDRRLAQLSEDAKRREENMKADAKDRETSLDKAHEREMRGLRESMSGQIEGIRSAETGKSMIAEKAAGVEVSALKNEMARMGIELQAKQAELETLRARLNKTVESAIDEACGLAERVGWGPAQGKEEEKQDWKDVLAQSVGAAIKGVPQILQDVQRVRVENQRAAVAAARPPAYVRQPVATVLPGMQPPPAVAPAEQQPRRAWRAPRPGFGEPPRGTPPEAGSNPYAPAPYAGPPLAAETPETPRAPEGQVQGQRVEPASAPSAPPPAFTYGPSEAPVTSAPPPVPVAVASPAPVAPPAGVDISPDAIGTLVQNLEMAVNTGAVEPAVFANEIVALLGHGPTAQILRNMTADGLCDNIAASKGGVLSTHEGRTYIRKLWDEAGKIVGTP